VRAPRVPRPRAEDAKAYHGQEVRADLPNVRVGVLAATGEAQLMYLRFLQPLPELERLRLRCNAGFHTTPPVECGRTRGGEREFPHWREQGAGSREQGAGSREQYATLRLERGTQYGWASRRPTSHADSTASHP